MNYIESTNQNLICCICRAPFTDPVTSRSCLHTFCKTCIFQALEHSGLCPIDRCPLKEENLIQADPIIRSLVDELLVECAECSMVMQRHRVSRHRTNDCENIAVRCPDLRCEQTVLRKELKKLDERVCPHQSKACEGCQESMLLAELEFHQPKCLLRVTTCTACEESLPRSELRSHSESCPGVVISCNQSEYGCSWTGPRRLFESPTGSHLATCPFNAIASFFTLNDARFNIVEEEKAELQRKVNTLEGVMNTMRSEMQALHDSLGPWFSPVMNSNTSRSDTNAVSELLGESGSRRADGPRTDSPTVDFNSTREDINTHNIPAATMPVASASSITAVPPLPLHMLINDLATSVQSLSQSVTSQLKHSEGMNRRCELTELAMSNETLRLGEEIVALRTGIHGLRMQVHALLVDRNRFHSGGGEGPAEDNWNSGLHPPLLRAPAVHPPLQYAYGGYPAFGVGGPGNVKL